MANLIGKLNFVAKKILNNLEITLVVLMVFFSPFIVNYNDLPKGYELPKVTFFQVFTIILLASFLLKVIYNTAQSNIVKFDKSLIVVFTGIFLILIASIISPFQAKLSFDSLLNEMPWIGNSFRFQGAFTHILMVIFAYIVYKRITRKNIIFIFLALFLSSFIQSLTAFGQLSYFLKVDPTVIFEGYYINGTFGQANFYSGRIMLGILSGIFLISIGSNLLHKKSIYQYLYFLFFHSDCLNS